MAGKVEEIAEDRSWLTTACATRARSCRSCWRLRSLVSIFTRFDLDPAEVWADDAARQPGLFLAGLRGLLFGLPAARPALADAAEQRRLFAGQEAARCPAIAGLIEIIYLSWFVNCIVPAKLGDAYRSYLLKRDAGVSFSRTIGTILAERMIDLLILFSLLLRLGAS